MSNPVSATFKREVFKQETSECFILLVTIDHDDLLDPIRVSSDGVDTVSRSNTFVTFPFEITLPSDSDEEPPESKILIDNVDRQIVEAVRSITSPPSVLLEIVLASDVDTVEIDWPDFELIDVDYDALTVQGVLTQERFSAEPYPFLKFTPGNFPGLF